MMKLLGIQVVRVPVLPQANQKRHPRDRPNQRSKNRKQRPNVLMKKPAASVPPTPKESARETEPSEPSTSKKLTPKKRHASKDPAQKKLSVCKYYYKNQEKWGFKINGSEKYTVACLHYSCATSIVFGGEM